MSEKTNAESSADFLLKFADLSKRLAKLGVITYRADIIYGFYGSWMFIVTKGQEALRFGYDAKGMYLTAQISPIHQFDVPNQWTKLETTRPSKLFRNDEALSYAESVIRDKFGENSA